MQGVVEHRNMKNFARGNYGYERLCIFTKAAVNRVVTSSILYYTIRPYQQLEQELG